MNHLLIISRSLLSGKRGGIILGSTGNMRSKDLGNTLRWYQMSTGTGRSPTSSILSSSHLWMMHKRWKSTMIRRIRGQRGLCKLIDSPHRRDFGQRMLMRINRREETLGNCVRTLMRSVDPRVRHGRGTHSHWGQQETLTGVELNESLEAAAKLARSLIRQHGALVDNITLDAEQDLMQRLASAGAAEVPDTILSAFLSTLDSKEEGVESTRVKSAEVVEALAKVAKKTGTTRERLLKLLEQWMQADRSRAVKEVLLRAQKTLND